MQLTGYYQALSHLCRRERVVVVVVVVVVEAEALTREPGRAPLLTGTCRSVQYRGTMRVACEAPLDLLRTIKDHVDQIYCMTRIISTRP